MSSNKLTLILPIGPPGSGKTTLRNKIQDVIDNSNFDNIPEDVLTALDLSIKEPGIKFRYTCRDDLYSEVRKKNGSNKTRRILYDKFIDFKNTCLLDTNCIAYNDSVNATKLGRNFIVDMWKPDKIVLLNFRVDDENILLERTLRRTGHPTFPTGKEEQLSIIHKVSSGIEYADRDEYVNGYVVDLIVR
jgi:hypothetical protein